MQKRDLRARVPLRFLALAVLTLAVGDASSAAGNEELGSIPSERWFARGSKHVALSVGYGLGSAPGRETTGKRARSWETFRWWSSFPASE